VFSLDAAVAHWRALPNEVRLEARAYVSQAPPEIDTDLRRRLIVEGLV